MKIKVPKQVPIEILINIVQKELCGDCHILQYMNRNCQNCINKIEYEVIKDEEI